MDYILLSNYLDINKFCGRIGKRKIPFKDDSVEMYLIPHHDVGYALTRKHLEREDLFKKLGDKREYVFEGLIGKLDCHVPAREYSNRISALKKLEQNSDIVQEDFCKLMENLDLIKKMCFLNQAKKEKPVEAKTAFENIGTWIINPSAQIHLWLRAGLRRNKNNILKGLTEIWEDRYQSAKKEGFKSGLFNQYG